MEAAGSTEPFDVWDEVARVYAKRGLVLVVGAGLSVKSGLPT